MSTPASSARSGPNRAGSDTRSRSGAADFEVELGTGRAESGAQIRHAVADFETEVRRSATDFEAQTRTAVRDDGAVVVEPGSVHLLQADSALPEFHRGRVYMGLCGALLAVDELPPWECPEDCECEHDRLICPDCADRAVELSAR